MYIGSYATAADYECCGPEDVYGSLEHCASPQGVVSQDRDKLADHLQAALIADLTECCGPEDEDQEFLALVQEAKWESTHSETYSVYTLKGPAGTLGVVVVCEVEVV